jgi:hypothetical protein
VSEETLVGALEKIRAIIDGALAHRMRPARKGNAARKDNSASASAATLPGHILALRNSAFFKQPKTAAEVQEKLNPSYHCETDRVVTALLRLKNKRELRKTTKTVGQRKLVAYVW